MRDKKAVELNNCVSNLYEYITHLKKYDVILTNTNSRKDFIDFAREVSGGELNYSDAMIKKAFRKLVDHKVLIKISRGVYNLNRYEE